MTAGKGTIWDLMWGKLLGHQGGEAWGNPGGLHGGGVEAGTV